MSGGLAEINLAGCSHAFDVSSIRREVQIGFKDLSLRVVALQFESANNLDDLSRERAGRQMIMQPRHLHGNGRSAAMCPARSQTKARPHQCDRVNSGMIPIVFVFKFKCRIDQRGRNVWQRSPDSKFLIGGQSNAKQFPVSIANALRERNALEQWRLW